MTDVPVPDEQQCRRIVFSKGRLSTADREQVLRMDALSRLFHDGNEYKA